MILDRQSIGVGLGLVLLGGGWAWYSWTQPDPQVVKVDQLEQQLAAPEMSNLSPEQQRDLRRQFAQEKAKLSARQLAQMWDARRAAFQQKMDGFFALSREQRLTVLDAEIDRMERLRKESVASRKSGDAGAPGSPGQSERQLKERLDLTSPEERAKAAMFFKQLNERRQARGLPLAHP